MREIKFRVWDKKTKKMREETLVKGQNYKKFENRCIELESEV